MAARTSGNSRVAPASSRALIATTNAGKLREIRELLRDAPVTLIGLADLPPIVEPEETGVTFEENARLKALYYDAHLGATLQQRHPSALTVAEVAEMARDAGMAPGAVRMTSDRHWTLAFRKP